MRNTARLYSISNVRERTLADRQTDRRNVICEVLTICNLRCPTFLHFTRVLFPRFRICSNDQFSGEELKLAEDFKKKFRSTAMTIVSFYEVDFTSDKTFLLQVGANVISGLWDPTLNSRLLRVSAIMWERLLFCF